MSYAIREFSVGRFSRHQALAEKIELIRRLWVWLNIPDFNLIHRKFEFKKTSKTNVFLDEPLIEFEVLIMNNIRN
jgi:hypothetical protein